MERAIRTALVIATLATVGSCAILSQADVPTIALGAVPAMRQVVPASVTLGSLERYAI